MQSAHTIDLTPEGARTPEGCARINAAIEAHEAAILRCANALDAMLDSPDDADKREAREARKARIVAQEEMLRAICGAPAIGKGNGGAS